MVDDPNVVAQVRIHCDSTDCKNAANHRPVLILYRPGPFPPLHIPLEVWVCNEHKATTTVDSLMSEKQWRHMCINFALAGQPKPIREKTELQWAQLT